MNFDYTYFLFLIPIALISFVLIQFVKAKDRPYNDIHHSSFEDDGCYAEDEYDPD